MEEDDEEGKPGTELGKGWRSKLNIELDHFAPRAVSELLVRQDDVAARPA